MFFLPKKKKIYVKEFLSKEGGVRVGALMSFDGKMKDEILQRFKQNYNVEGDHIQNGGRISPKTILTLAGSGGGALGMSAAMSGNLFVATANPATLMAIGNGVGSAVVGAGGIISQAPFIAAGAAMMPILAPLLAFQAISTVLILNQFKHIHKKLDHIEKSLNRVIQRSEATYIGEMISAVNRIEEIEHNFSICNRFTTDMMIRLALVEDKVNPIFERYKFLFEAQGVVKRTTKDDLGFKINDAYHAIILSILDLRIDVLRLKLAIQENPGVMRDSTERLISKATAYKQFWDVVGKSPNAITEVAIELKKAVCHMNWWHQNMPGWLLGKRAERKELQEKISDFKDQRKQAKHSLESLAIAQEYVAAINEEMSELKYMNLVYWKDEFGEHSYYTDDLRVVNE